MRVFPAIIAILALGLVHGGTASANPPNSTATGPGWQCNPGYRRIGYECRSSNIIRPPPDNAVGQGAHWYCKPGYRRVAGQCSKVQTPPDNASVNTVRENPGTATYQDITEPRDSRRVTTWECDSGYERVGNRCQRKPTPPNAFRVGTGWTCYKGYRRVEDQCQKIDARD